MLQRFPVESKGRRKKLQEVHFGFCWSEFFGYFCTNYTLVMYSAYLDAGWLCDYHLLFLFLDQMRHGKQLHFLWTGVTSTIQIIRCFGLSRYIAFAIPLDIHYV